MVPQFSINYSVNSSEKYGPTWRNRRPRGLPADVRLTSARGQGRVHVRQAATRQWRSLGTSYEDRARLVVGTIEHLAQTESGSMLALPAGNFGSNVHAWGIFQFNDAIWQHYTSRILGRIQRHSWEANTQEEICIPIICYCDAAKSVIDAGGSDIFVARGIRIWQRAVPIFRRWLARAERTSFEHAWNTVENIAPQTRVGQNIISTVTRHINDSGLVGIVRPSG